MNNLFEPTTLGALRLQNRVVMAPLTRNRADPMGAPAPYAKDYYAQRADAGLIVSEGTQPDERTSMRPTSTSSPSARLA